MYVLFALIYLVAIIICIVFGIKSIKLKKTGVDNSKTKKICIGAGFVFVIAFLITGILNPIEKDNADDYVKETKSPEKNISNDAVKADIEDVALDLLSTENDNVEKQDVEENISDDKDSSDIVDENSLITTVKAVVDGQVGKGEKIIDVIFDGSDLKVVVDMSGADTSMFSTKELAENRIASITDKILELDEDYYNFWETITIDFGNEGKATLDKSMIKDEGYGKFFDFPAGILK